MLLTHHTDTLNTYLIGRCELANGKITQYTYLFRVGNRYVWHGGQIENQGGQTKFFFRRFAPNFAHPGLKPCRRPWRMFSMFFAVYYLIVITIRVALSIGAMNIINKSKARIITCKNLFELFERQ